MRGHSGKTYQVWCKDCHVYLVSSMQVTLEQANAVRDVHRIDHENHRVEYL